MGTPDTVPATPEYVLAVLRDFQRIGASFDVDFDPDLEVTFETRVDEWWWFVGDCADWRAVGESMNWLWGIKVSVEEWRSVLRPETRRTLRGVCGLIARHARRPVFGPVTLFGGASRAAGAFLRLRELMAARDPDAERIAPSTPLEPYLAGPHFATLFGCGMRLAPGVLPDVRYRPRPSRRRSLEVAAAWATGAALALPLLLSVVGPADVAAGVCVAGVFLAAALLAAARCFSAVPSAVEFGGLVTFRDLAARIAAS